MEPLPTLELVVEFIKNPTSTYEPEAISPSLSYRFVDSYMIFLLHIFYSTFYPPRHHSVIIPFFRHLATFIFSCTDFLLLIFLHFYVMVILLSREKENQHDPSTTTDHDPLRPHSTNLISCQTPQHDKLGTYYTSLLHIIRSNS